MSTSGKHESMSTCSDWRDQYVNERWHGVHCAAGTLGSRVGKFILGGRQRILHRPSLEHGTPCSVSQSSYINSDDQEHLSFKLFLQRPNITRDKYHKEKHSFHFALTCQTFLFLQMFFIIISAIVLGLDGYLITSQGLNSAQRYVYPWNIAQSPATLLIPSTRVICSACR